MPQKLLNSMKFHSDVCHKHTYIKDHQEVVKPIQKMIINGEVVCPRCESEKNDRQLQEELQQQYESAKERQNYNTLYKHSIIEDETLLNATFANYHVTQKEETANKQILLEGVERLKRGQVFNVILQGNQGSGKSHLAYAALRELNEQGADTTCLFVNVESMLRKLKNSFNDRESKYTESYLVELMSSVTFLVLDDIGAETGAIETDKTATDFVQRILYAITTTRQNKATFITTNLSSKTLFKMYDKKLVSRMLKNPKYIVFQETKDKRIGTLPF